MTDADYKRFFEESRTMTAAALGDKKCGVWYPASDPPKADIYGLAFCVSGKRGKMEYHHGLMLDDCNCYEEGKFWPQGNISEELTVNAWMALPECEIE